MLHNNKERAQSAALFVVRLFYLTETPNGCSVTPALFQFHPNTFNHINRAGSVARTQIVCASSGTTAPSMEVTALFLTIDTTRSANHVYVMQNRPGRFVTQCAAGSIRTVGKSFFGILDADFFAFDFALELARQAYTNWDQRAIASAIAIATR